jgi:hypothetical protein
MVGTRSENTLNSGGAGRSLIDKTLPSGAKLKKIKRRGHGAKTRQLAPPLIDMFLLLAHTILTC